MNNKGNKRNKKILELLYRSFDRTLSEKQQKRLDEALKNSEELRREKNRAIKLRKSASDTAKLSFNPFFAERVLSRIETVQSKNGLEAYYQSLKVVFRRVAVAGAVVMLGLLLYNFQIGDCLNSDEILYVSDTTIEEILDYSLF
jgi:hypothetical protein